MNKVNSQMVKDILAAIKSVRTRLQHELQEGGSYATQHRLMGDLVALEVCLVIETEQLIAALDKAA